MLRRFNEYITFASNLFLRLRNFFCRNFFSLFFLHKIITLTCVYDRKFPPILSVTVESFDVWGHRYQLPIALYLIKKCPDLQLSFICKEISIFFLSTCQLLK